MADRNIINSILSGNNNPPIGEIIFDSSDHIRYQNGIDVSGHNYGASRRVVIQQNISGGRGYSVTVYNLNGVHPVWQNNVQMATKPMEIVKVSGNKVTLRGFGYDTRAIAMGIPREVASFSDYGIIVTFSGTTISSISLELLDRNVSILYLR